MDDASDFERTYEVTINGLVPPAVLAEIGEVEACSQETQTILSGDFQDESEVYGFLEKLRTYALEVVEIRRRVSAEPGDPESERP